MVSRESRRLWVLALGILRDESEAEDAVQDTLIRAWRSKDSLGDYVKVAPWLTRVCVNRCISRRRNLQIRGWSRQQPLEEMAAGERGTTEDLIDVDRAFRRLSVRQRAAITLNYLHGYSVDECAEIMRCRPGTVRSHLARGLAALNGTLSDG